MQFVERKIVELLLQTAAQHEFVCRRFACQPKTGYRDDEINSTEGLKLEQIEKFAKEWDTFFIAEFSNGDEEDAFWVLLVTGNGTDLISDYLATGAAEKIVTAVYKVIEGD